jgi:cytochrome c556
MLRSVALPVTICLSVGITAVLAHEDATGIVAERMESMKAMGSEMKALAEMFKAPETFDQERAVAASEAVASHAESIPELFPQGSAEPPSDASEAIWDDWDQCASHSTDLQEAALEFGAAAEADAEPPALKPDFEAMASGCKACHQDFRLPG